MNSEKKILEIKNLSINSKIKLLNELGYKVRGNVIFNCLGDIVRDRYTHEIVDITNICILPTSVKNDSLILDCNVLSLMLYEEEFGEI